MNLSKPSDAPVRRRTRFPLLQIITCRLLGTQAFTWTSAEVLSIGWALRNPFHWNWNGNKTAFFKKIALNILFASLFPSRFDIFHVYEICTKCRYATQTAWRKVQLWRLFKFTWIHGYHHKKTRLLFFLYSGYINGNFYTHNNPAYILHPKFSTNYQWRAAEYLIPK